MRFPLGERVYMRCIFPQSQLYSSFGASFDMGCFYFDDTLEVRARFGGRFSALCVVR